jgi:dolichol kinase
MVREKEQSSLTGSSYVLVAAFVSYLAFGKEIAILCVSFLAIGDVAAAVVGQRFGRTRLLGKAVEGDLACFFSCLAIGFILYYLGLDVILPTIAIGAMGAAVGQAVQTPVDDNLTIPLLAGLLMAVMPG